MSTDQVALLNNSQASKGVLHPLPLDVVIDILQEADCTPKDRSEYLPMVRFSQVSRSWRTFVHSTPTLWRKLKLTCSRSEKDRVAFWQLKSDTKAISLYTAMSRGAPIQLVIRQGYRCTEVHSQAFDYYYFFEREFMPALATLLRQCGDLRILNYDTLHSMLFAEGTPGSDALYEAINSSNVLKSLTVLKMLRRPSQFAKQMLSNLHRLKFWYDCGCRGLDRFLPETPLKLRDLCISAVPSSEFLKVACRLPNLEKLDLWIDDSTALPPRRNNHEATIGHVENITIPVQTFLHLRELRIVLFNLYKGQPCSPVTVWDLFNSLDLPALESLKMDIDRGYEDPRVLYSAFADFLHRAARLSELRIICKKATTVVWIRQLVLPAVPNLQVLRVDTGDVGNEIREDIHDLIDAMAETCAEPAMNDGDDPRLTIRIPKLCPKLRKFVLNLCHVDGISLEGMARFIVTRYTDISQPTAAHSHQPFYASFRFSKTGMKLRDCLEHPEIASRCKDAKKFKLKVPRKRGAPPRPYRPGLFKWWWVFWDAK